MTKRGSSSHSLAGSASPRRTGRNSASAKPRSGKRSRARSGSSPECGHVYIPATGGALVCAESGDHFCEPRSARTEAFFTELLVHTKGRWSRQRFILSPWQLDHIVRPLFGTVTWNGEAGQYVRRYRICWIEVARKNGKSELLAGIALYLLCADDEESAEIYGAAGTRDQARKVFDVAARMVQLSPVLSARLEIKAYQKRIIDPKTASYYEVISADAGSNLGHNPHGVVFDEVLVQPNADLWDALRTGMGARSQPVMVAATTAGNDPASFAAVQSQEMTRVAADLGRAPHILVYQRTLSKDADPWDETNWPQSNPALGDFLAVQALRDEAAEARNDPTRENAFRQFRLNQWVQQVTRWMPIHVWDACGGLIVEDQLVGLPCYGGLDLAAVSDLTSLCWFFPADAADSNGQQHSVIWRHFVPEQAVARLDDHTAGQFSIWARDGFVAVTEGDVVDYSVLHDQIEADSARFAPVTIGIDRWNSVATTNWLQANIPNVLPLLVSQSYAGMSAPLKEIMRLAKSQKLNHGGNPVARWCFDAVEVRQDPAENIKPVKPERVRSGKRIDAVTAAAMAVDGWIRQRPALVGQFHAV